MSAIANLTEEEMYLAAILDDASGVELAEFLWVDEEQPDGIFRLWDFQWVWFRDEATYQIDWCGRALGKSTGIIMRAFAFPFTHPGAEMLITAPELNHLRPITDKVEHLFKNTRLGRAMLPKQRGDGINHQPQFQAHFINNARIMSRLPGLSGKGVKGCIGPGALVLTKRGQVPIEEVVIGDEVLSHRGWWRKVQQVLTATDVDGFRIQGGGNREIFASRNHQMWSRSDRSAGKAKRNLDMADWTILEAPLRGCALTDHFLGSPTTFPVASVPWGRFDQATAWAVGRYVADGFLAWQTKRSGTRSSARLHVIVDRSHEADVSARMTAAGLRPTSRLRENGTYDIEVSDTELCRFADEHFGQHADGKEIPTWLLGAPESIRRSFLDGYLSGDGHYEPLRGRWTAGTASKKLAVNLRLLAQSLGYSSGLSWVDPKVRHVMGVKLKKSAMRSWRVTMTEKRGTSLVEDDVAWQKVRKVEDVTLPTAYDLVVEHDHSYVADGLIHHNQHPLVIEMDEGQDYPENGWVELVETMKAGTPGAQWRVHGVSRGIRDRYYQYTIGEDPDIPFKVHRYMAMHRPSWGVIERRNKIAIYGGTSDNVDYKRNIYGDHGDATNPVFVLARLMANVRIAEDAWAVEYNESVYWKVKIEHELLQSYGAMAPFLDTIPGNHLDEKYHSYWGGMDVGFTRDPSEILVFGALQHPKQKGVDMLRLLLRVHLMRIGAPDQADAVRLIMGFYGERLRAFAMDKTGNGLPLWQEMDPAATGTSMHLRRTPAHIAQKIRGYGFSNKVAVEFDDRALVGREKPEDAVIQKNVVDFATDELRKVVDTYRIELPNDRELLTEFQGQEIQYQRDEGSAAGIKARRYGGASGAGSFHTLDAAKMMMAAKSLANIEAALAVSSQTPVLARFG